MDVMERVYSKVRSEEVAPELRNAMVRASTRHVTEEFGRDLETEPTLVDGCMCGLSRDQRTRRWFHRVSSATDALNPGAATPLGPSAPGIMSRRVKALALSDGQERVVLKWPRFVREGGIETLPEQHQCVPFAPVFPLPFLSFFCDWDFFLYLFGWGPSNY